MITILCITEPKIPRVFLYMLAYLVMSIVALIKLITVAALK